MKIIAIKWIRRIENNDGRKRCYSLTNLGRSYYKIANEGNWFDLLKYLIKGKAGSKLRKKISFVFSNQSIKVIQLNESWTFSAEIHKKIAELSIKSEKILKQLNENKQNLMMKSNLENQIFKLKSNIEKIYEFCR